MDQAQPTRRLGLPLLLIATLLACVAFTPGPAGAADENASPDTVAAGLQKILDIAAGSAKAVGNNNPRAEELHAGIEPVWEGIEGTVRANDSSAYVALEDGFTLLKIAAMAADPSKASKASEDLSSAVKGYLVAHPGDAAAATRTAAAAPSSDSAAPAEGAAESAAGAGTLARTGAGPSTLGRLAGASLGLGGLAVIGGARRRRRG